MGNWERLVWNQRHLLLDGLAQDAIDQRPRLDHHPQQLHLALAIEQIC